MRAREEALKIREEKAAAYTRRRTSTRLVEQTINEKTREISRELTKCQGKLARCQDKLAAANNSISAATESRRDAYVQTLHPAPPIKARVHIGVLNSPAHRQALDTILCMAKDFLEGGARHDQVKWQKIHDKSLAKRMIIYCDAAHFAKLKPDERKGVINRNQMNASERAALHALVLVFNRVTENTGHPREIEILLAEPGAPVQEIHSDTSIHDKKLLRNATTLLNDCKKQKGTRVMTTGFEGEHKLEEGSRETIGARVFKVITNQCIPQWEWKQAQFNSTAGYGDITDFISWVPHGGTGNLQSKDNRWALFMSWGGSVEAFDCYTDEEVVTFEEYHAQQRGSNVDTIDFAKDVPQKPPDKDVSQKSSD